LDYDTYFSLYGAIHPGEKSEGEMSGEKCLGTEAFIDDSGDKISVLLDGESEWQFLLTFHIG